MYYNYIFIFNILMVDKEKEDNLKKIYFDPNLPSK